MTWKPLMFDSPLLKCCWFWRESEEIKAALFLFSFCFVALPLIRNTAFLTQLSVQGLYLLITTVRLAKQRFSHWWVLLQCKVQWIKGPGYCTKRSSWGWRWGRNQHSQLCSTAGRRNQDIALPNLGLTWKISLASCNYLSLEFKNFWWTKALLTEHSWRCRNILLLFAIYSGGSTECLYPLTTYISSFNLLSFLWTFSEWYLTDSYSELLGCLQLEIAVCSWKCNPSL